MLFDKPLETDTDKKIKQLDKINEKLTKDINEDKIIFQDKYLLEMNKHKRQYQYHWKDAETDQLLTLGVEGKYLTSNHEKRDEEIAKLLTKVNSEIKESEVLEFLEKEALKQANIEIKEIEEENSLWRQLKNNPEKKALHIDVATEIEEVYTIKKVIDKNKPTYYYFNKSEKSYERLNSNNLGIIIKNDYGYSYPDNTLKSILSCIQNENTLDNALWEFDNCIFNSEKYEMMKDDKKDLFTVKKIGVKNKDGSIEKLTFNKNVDLFNDKESLVEKTLKEILIPKDNPNKTELFKDYLQRLGACLIEDNPYKSTPVYTGKGNNGKSILNFINKLIFNEYHVTINPAMLKDAFSDGVIGGTSLITFDELQEDSFMNVIDVVKKLTGGVISNTSRIMFSQDKSEITDFGMVWIFTNVIPALPLTDKAIYIRLNVFELPNQFVIKNELNRSPNNYLIDTDINNKLKQDKKGLSWLISASIKAYKEMIDNNATFLCEQTPANTMAIINKTDPLSTYLTTYTEISEFGTVTNKEILIGFQDYILDNNIEYHELDEITISKKIGHTLKTIYKDNLKKIPARQGAKYNLKLISKTQIDNKYKYAYEIEEYDLETLKQVEYLSGDELIVYNEIKKGNNTINSILNEHNNIEVMKQVISLENKGLIHNTHNMVLVP